MPGHDTRPHARLLLSFRAWMRPQVHDLTHSFDSQAARVIDVLGLFAMLLIIVCTTRHWQTSGRLVQALNVCTLYKYVLTMALAIKESISLRCIYRYKTNKRQLSPIGFA